MNLIRAFSNSLYQIEFVKELTKKKEQTTNNFSVSSMPSVVIAFPFFIPLDKREAFVIWC